MNRSTKLIMPQDLCFRILMPEYKMCIRDRDYVNHPLFRGICDLDYYKRAIHYMEERVNPDGELRDHFRKLKYVFQTEEEWFFRHYVSMDVPAKDVYKRQELCCMIPDKIALATGQC